MAVIWTLPYFSRTILMDLVYCGVTNWISQKREITFGMGAVTISGLNGLECFFVINS